MLLEEQELSGSNAFYNATMLCIMMALLYADQNLMAPNLTAIARDFGFSDEERDQKLGGEIALGFFILGAPIALGAGYLADLTTRKIVFVIVVFLGEIPALCTLFVTEYWQLFVLRCLTGIAIGGGPPLVMSMLGDMFNASTRVSVMSYFVALGALGVALGQLVSGMVGPTFGWRVPFAIIAIPSCILNVLVLFTVAEPKRGYADLSESDHFKKDKDGQTSMVYEYNERITPGKMLGLYTIKTNVVFFLQGIPGCLPWVSSPLPPTPSTPCPARGCFNESKPGSIARTVLS